MAQRKNQPVESTAEEVDGTGVVAEVVRQGSIFDEDTLRNLSSFDQALDLFQNTPDGIVTADQEMGDGFTVLETGKKRRLIDVPLLFMEWEFYKGDYGDNSEFVAARVLAKFEGGGLGKYILNDGSAGIFRQLKAYTEKTGRRSGLIARNGLRVSDYEYTDDNGNTAPASTFYIDVSA
jgi:hypothetical protein